MFGVSRYKLLNRLAQLGGALRAQAAQGFPRQNAKPNLHLIQPTGRGGGKVKVDLRVLGQPSVALFMRAVIVQNDMQFLIGG